MSVVETFLSHCTFRHAIVDDLAVGEFPNCSAILYFLNPFDKPCQGGSYCFNSSTSWFVEINFGFISTTKGQKIRQDHRVIRVMFSWTDQCLYCISTKFSNSKGE